MLELESRTDAPLRVLKRAKAYSVVLLDGPESYAVTVTQAQANVQQSEREPSVGQKKRGKR